MFLNRYNLLYDLIKFIFKHFGRQYDLFALFLRILWPHKHFFEIILCFKSPIIKNIIIEMNDYKKKKM